MRSAFFLAGLFLFSAPAQAGLVFNFQFQNVNGLINGTVSGKITLNGSGDGVFSATSIIVEAAPAALGYTTPFDVFTLMNQDIQNTFTVSGGQIVSSGSSFGRQSGSNGNAFALNFSALGSLLSPIVGTNPSAGVQDVNDSTLTYSSAPSAVPEPSTAIALMTLCGVASGLRRMRRQHKHLPPKFPRRHFQATT